MYYSSLYYRQFYSDAIFTLLAITAVMAPCCRARKCKYFAALTVRLPALTVEAL